MQITSSSSVQTAVATPVAVPSSSAASQPPAVTDTDAVTLSDAAQAAMATPSATGPTATWTSDSVKGALAALNDTSGNTSEADQLSAYKTMTALVADASNFDPTKPQNADAVDVATAFATSAYVEHYRALEAQFTAFTRDMTGDSWGKDQSDSQQRQLNYFDSLSENDQHILVDTHAASLSAVGYRTGPTELADYRTSLQTSINVSRAVEALVASPGYADEIAANQSSIKGASVDSVTATIAVITAKAQADGDTQTQDLMKLVRSGNDFQAQAQAYFAKYGPAPEQSDAEKAADATAPLPASRYRPSGDDMVTFFSDVATLTDAKGTATPSELVSSYKFIFDKSVQSISTTNGDVAWVVGLHTINDTLGYKLISDAQSAYTSAVNIDSSRSYLENAQSSYQAFEHLDDFNQEIYAGLYGADNQSDTGTVSQMRSKFTFFISNAAQGEAIRALNTAKDSGHLKADSTVTILGVTLNLNSIMASNDMHLDPYTRMSSDVKALLQEAAEKWVAGEKVSIDATKLGGVPPTEAEKALAALKAYAAGDAPKTDADKAVDALKDRSDHSLEAAALTLLKTTDQQTDAAGYAKKEHALPAQDGHLEDKKGTNPAGMVLNLSA